MERFFSKPTITSQITNCPVPFSIKSYTGCQFSCVYCFARDCVEFSRRRSEHKEFGYLTGNRPDLFKKWIEKVMNKEYDYNRPEEVAFRERIPIKLGTTSDPLPPIEREERITHDILKILGEYDYPCQLHTKNPCLFAELYSDEFIGANLTISVTLISDDEDFSRTIEPKAPSPSERLKAIKELTDKGYNVMVKIQPAIYPKILEDLPQVIKKASEAGAWAFNIEGLKCRKTVPIKDRKSMQVIGDYLGMNIRDFLKEEGKLPCHKSNDYELSNEKKIEIFKIAKNLSEKYNIKFFNADNFMDKNYGASCECCGTEKLRNYKLLSCDRRSRIYGNSKGSLEVEKCKINFLRNKKIKVTIKEYCDKYCDEHSE